MLANFLILIFVCFQAKGASIGDVFLISDVAFHDRRIPIPVSVSQFSFLHFTFLQKSWRYSSLPFCLVQKLHGPIPQT